jgi:C4-dicarboxylate-specific signal transduction histidine kinase
MADIQPTPNHVLNTIAARLLERADAITNVTCQDLADDLRLTSGIVERLARLHSEISEIASKTKDADTASALRTTLSAVEPLR